VYNETVHSCGNTLQVILEMNFPASLLTGTKHPAFSANHLTDIDNTKHNYNQQQHRNLNSQTRELLTYEQTEPNETKAWFKGILCHPATKGSGLLLWGRHVVKPINRLPGCPGCSNISICGVRYEDLTVRLNPVHH